MMMKKKPGRSFSLCELRKGEAISQSIRVGLNEKACFETELICATPLHWTKYFIKVFLDQIELHVRIFRTTLIMENIKVVKRVFRLNFLFSATFSPFSSAG